MTDLSILDLAEVHDGSTVAGALTDAVELAQHAEAWGYRRVWYAEHHNMPRASSATSVVIAHVAAQTRHIRVGAGGIMLPNHSPLTIAEQFGTLEALHPGRIDLGLGRAPGTDQATVRALRRNPEAAERFPDDVVELQGYLSDESRIPGVRATPGQGSHVPLTILGSSLFGAHVAAALGLPFAFASHFSPGALTEAVAIYRQHFQPSAQLEVPHVIAGFGVIASDDEQDAQTQLLAARRRRARRLFSRERTFTDEEADEILASPAGARVREMTTYLAAGTPAQVRGELDRFVVHADADELILVCPARDHTARLRTFELLAPTG